MPSRLSRADLTPSGPPGIVTVTRVCWWKPLVGTNSRVLVPVPCQLPATLGLIVGSGESAASGAENWTLMAVVPVTPLAPAAGVSDTSCSGPLGTCDDALALGSACGLPAGGRWLRRSMGEGNPDARDQQEDDRAADSGDPPAQVRQ